MIKRTELLDQVRWPQNEFNFRDHSILIGYRGSQAHGTFIPSTDPNSIDDIDLMAVVIAEQNCYVGLGSWDEAEGINGPWDIKAYEIRKFIRLLVKQNPNVLTLLWLEPEDYLFLSPLGDELLKIRDKFSSRQSAKAFCGYAKDQLNKMTHVAGRGYLGAKRKQLVEKYGYDCKNAGHLLRLLHMGIEFLETGKLNVKRTWDKDLLIDIKTGKYSLIDVHKLAADAFTKIDHAEKNSVLPPRISGKDLKLIDDICQSIIKDWFGWYENE